MKACFTKGSCGYVTDERLRERGGGLPGNGLRKHPERWKTEEWNEEWGNPSQTSENATWKL